jgi:hypothetical protein
MDMSIAERVAVLEAEVKIIKEHNLLVLSQLTTINDSLIKYKGFVGGIAFVATSIVTFVSFAKEWVIAHLK